MMARLLRFQHLMRYLRLAQPEGLVRLTRRLVVAAAVAAPVMALAQQAATGMTPSQIDAERARIASERSAADAKFLAEEKECYRRFAVNDCLKDVQRRKHTVVADLRRQEVLLNDAERRRKGAEALQKLEDRSSAEKQQEAAERRAKALQDQHEREERAAKKAETAAENAQKASSRVQAQIGKDQQMADKAASRASQAAAAPSNAAQFEQKQKDAAERRDRVAKRNADRAKPAASSLPAIPAPLPPSVKAP